jgi:hypothetical protein
VADTNGLLRDAVDLVQRDVTAVLGPGSVVVALTAERETVRLLEVNNPELLDTLTRPGMREFTDVDAWVFVPGDVGAVGLRLQESESFADLVARTAEIIQEAVIESSTYFGAAFPPCPAHPNHPLWPEVRDRAPVWVCPTDRAVAVAIGAGQVSR